MDMGTMLDIHGSSGVGSVVSRGGAVLDVQFTEAGKLQLAID